MKSLYLLLLTLFVSALCSARKATFRVISFGSKTQVEIVGGEKYTLPLYSNKDILYEGSITNLPEGDFKYYYVVDGVRENFERKFSKNDKSTYIEFYGRKDTVKSLPTFSYSGAKWNKSIGRTPLFDQSYIPTIHITGKTVETLMKKPSNKYYNLENVTFYLKDSVQYFQNVKTNPENREFAKFQMRMEIINDNIYGRTLLKLCNGGEDPLNLRQLIYGNILEAIGVPSIKSVMVRVYYNKKPAGFYTLQEEAFSESFVKAEFHGIPKTGEIKNEKIGEPFNGEAGAEFDYSSNLDYYSQFKSNKKNPDKTKLRALTKAINNLNTKKEKELKNFEKQWFDIDSFHKVMAMEYLTAAWNGYWYSGANFALYDVPQESSKNTFKHYFIGQVHDETWGVGLCNEHLFDGDNQPKLSYKVLLQKKKNRLLVKKFITSTPALQKRFENTLVSITKQIMEPSKFKKVVQAHYDRYYDEMKWDFSFERAYKPSAKAAKDMPVYEFKDFENGLTKIVGGLRFPLYSYNEESYKALKEEFKF